MRDRSVLLRGFLFLGLLFAALPAQAQSLRIGLVSDPDTLDPTASRSVASRQVFAAMCDKLVDIGPDLSFVPQLATEWRWTNEDRTLALTLRPNVHMHDGSIMDAEAVAASLRRHLSLPGSTRKAELGPVQSIDIAGPLAVNINLARPFAPLVAVLSDRAGMIMPARAAALPIVDFQANPSCAGPFRFVRRVAQDRIDLDRFPEYWNAPAIHFDHLTYRPVTDASVRDLDLRAGSLDLIEYVLPSDVAAMNADKRVRLTREPSLASVYIAVNVGHGARADTPLGRNQAVREALDLAIDRRVLNQVAFDGAYTPGNQSVPPGNPFYTNSIPVPGRDVAKARAVLKAAGFDRVSMEMSVPNTSDYLQSSEIIQSMAAEAGIDIKLRVIEVATLLKQWTDGDFESLIILWSGRTDVDSNLYNFNACGQALNGGGYCNNQVDALLDAARGTTDMSRRNAEYEQANRILLSERPYIYLWHPVLIFGSTAKLAGFTPVPDGLMRLQNVSLGP